MNLYEALNGKRNQGEDLCVKLNGRRAATISKIVSVGLVINISRSEQREAIPRYQTLFAREIEGLDPPKKFTPLRFTLYDGKRARNNHYQRHTIRAKAFITSEVLLLSEFGTITTLEAWTGGNDQRYPQGMPRDKRWLER